MNGLYEQLGNEMNRQELQVEFGADAIRHAFRSLFNHREPDRTIVIQTGRAGMEIYNEALRRETHNLLGISSDRLAPQMPLYNMSDFRASPVQIDMSEGRYQWSVPVEGQPYPIIVPDSLSLVDAMRPLQIENNIRMDQALYSDECPRASIEINDVKEAVEWMLN